MRWNEPVTVSAFLLAIVLGQAYPSARQDQLVYRKKYAMGTVFEVAAYGPSPARTSRAIEQAFREVLRLDRVMSDYIPESDLSRINRTAHYRAEQVPADLYRVIQQSLIYSRLSSGEFDITVGPLARIWKAEIRDGTVPSKEQEEKVRRCVGWQKVSLLPPDRVEFRSPCLAIDLGAIGKGYAVDQAVAVLRSFGIERALISAGGSTIYAMGSPPGRPAWVVRLRDPSGKLNPEVSLNGNSVSTSEQTRDPEHRSTPYGHIIDPAKGVPLKTPYSVSVVVGSATASDALSTTLLLMGPERGKSLVKKLPKVAAIWISGKGKFELCSSGPQISINSSSGPKC
ncbi:MAG: FAD:protein FMN transferase [Acidobacteria bacterium]|nr:MAG: FAD:protein FMN transferase [Acidobacteriota bacterium]